MSETHCTGHPASGFEFDEVHFNDLDGLVAELPKPTNQQHLSALDAAMRNVFAVESNTADLRRTVESLNDMVSWYVAELAGQNAYIEKLHADVRRLQEENRLLGQDFYVHEIGGLQRAMGSLMTKNGSLQAEIQELKDAATIF